VVLTPILLVFVLQVGIVRQRHRTIHTDRLTYKLTVRYTGNIQTDSHRNLPSDIQITYRHYQTFPQTVNFLDKMFPRQIMKFNSK